MHGPACSLRTRRSEHHQKGAWLFTIRQISNRSMSETSFKIKCSKSASARRFSLSKPTLADLRSHVEASWGASGPSFWYVDDDGDRIEVLDDNDFDAASSQLKSSCVCLNVEFVSDRIEFKSSGNGDWVSSVASSETSHDDDGFISVELHRSVEDALLPIAVAEVPVSPTEHQKHTSEIQEHDFNHEHLFHDCGGLQNQGLQDDAAYHRKIANAIEDLVTSSGMGWSHESFRAAVESSDAASLKIMIRNALILNSCVTQVQEIAHTAIKRIEHCMSKSLNAERREHKSAAKFEQYLMAQPSAEQLKRVHTQDGRVDDAAAVRAHATQRIENQLAARNKIVSRFAGIVNTGHPLCDTSSAEYAHQCHRAQTLREMERAQVAATIERNLATRHTLRELKKAHIVVAPVEARAAALERAMNARRLEKDLCRNRLAPRHSDTPVDMPEKPNLFSWASISGSHASSEEIQRYESCLATLGSMGFGEGEDMKLDALRLVIVQNNGDMDSILQNILS
jgi:hypothetical protein